ncbi:MAG TPA: MFS transporter [Bauldia sp.]|nr:MFS transporter [Bauldia sp.]
MRSTLLPISAILLGILFLIAGHGLQLALIPLRAAAEGWTPFAIGAIGSAYYVGFVAGCVGAPYIILRAGHIRAFAALVALTTSITLAQPLLVSVPSWLFFRFLIGACFAGLYMIFESWLNDRVSNSDRGLIMSTYIVTNFVALFVGQIAITLGTTTGFELFILAALSISLATIPIALTRLAQPAPPTLVRFRPGALYRRSPVAMIGIVVIGLANGAFWALAAVYALGEGLTSDQAALFTGLATVGGAIAQWPAGRLSDRIDRRVVLIVLLSGAVVVSFLLAFLPIGGHAWMVLAFLFGLTTLPTYAVAAAHAYDHAEPGSYVETSSGVLLANGIGAIIGPLVASTIMELTSTAMLFLFTGLAQGGLALFVMARLSRRAAPKTEEKTEFDLAATGTPVGGIILPPDALAEAADARPEAGRRDDAAR